MTELATKTHTDFILPPSVVQRADVSRLTTELERIDNELTTSAVRLKSGGTQQAPPTVSDQLAEFLTQNGLELKTSRERTELISQLRLLKDAAPSIHMTFAVAADPSSLKQLVQWLRSSVHPQTVIEVGLQPGLIAGVYLRTPNHVLDLSLRKLLSSRRSALAKELGALGGRR